MNNYRSSRRQASAFSLIEILICIAIIALLACLLLPKKVRAQNNGTPGSTVYQPNFYTTISNYTAYSMPSNSMVYFWPPTNQVITIRQNQGGGWMLSITSTNSIAGNFTVWFDINDGGGTNHWNTNSHYLSWTVAIVPNSTVVYFTNFSRDVVNNARMIFPSTVSNNITFGNPLINFLEETHGNQ
ncbi:MAG TPA: prepilin-type N-terminal cleavage/methylation domain-containing protein [Verrucomicrobiae bacterium]|nr:prepilin-type N-terminal cleavage/methylation domain-containing protein [Verrucomicrobiae bacterium]